jgi:hypothetical protein
VLGAFSYPENDMPKQDRQAERLKHVSGGGNMHKDTKVKEPKSTRKPGR